MRNRHEQWVIVCWLEGYWNLRTWADLDTDNILNRHCRLGKITLKE